MIPQLRVQHTDGYWGKASIEVINKVLRNNEGKSNAELIKLCRAAYPFNQREMHPYKIWCKKIQMLRRLLDGEVVQSPLKAKRAPDLRDTPLFGGVDA